MILWRCSKKQNLEEIIWDSDGKSSLIRRRSMWLIRDMM
jgi:hypothetical protein